MCGKWNRSLLSGSSNNKFSPSTMTKTSRFRRTQPRTSASYAALDGFPERAATTRSCKRTGSRSPCL
jgi:hypothetical protein